MKRVAIIPARGGSKRLPRKNILSMLGQPMIAYPVKSALNSGLFDQIIVSTEDDEIADISKDLGAEVLPRPSGLSTDKATVHQVVKHVLLELKQNVRLPETFCIIYPTAIFLEPRHLIDSVKLFLQRDIESVLAVQRFKPHPHKALIEKNNVLEPAFPDKFGNKGQNLQPFFVPAGAFHWMKSAAFLNAFGSIWQLRRVGYLLKSYEAIDIDEFEDLEMAKRLLLARSELMGKN